MRHLKSVHLNSHQILLCIHNSTSKEHRYNQPFKHIRRPTCKRKSIYTITKASASETINNKKDIRPFVLIECDGVILDVNNNGHRVAFNKAFKDLGLDCSNWSPIIYHDLLRSGNGTAEGLIQVYFDSVGWPKTLPSSDYDSFKKNVVKKKQKFFKEMVYNNDIPLRKGVIEFLREVDLAKAKMGVITCTLSDEVDDIWTNLASQNDIFKKMTEFKWTTKNDGNKSDEDYDDMTKDLSDIEKLELRLRQEIKNTKFREISAFVSNMKKPGDKNLPLKIDPSLLLSSEQKGPHPTWFLSLAAIIGTSINNTIFIGANGFSIKTAAAAGLLCMAVPPSLSQRGSFPGATCTCDGFGPGGGLTWSKLRMHLEKRNL